MSRVAAALLAVATLLAVAGCKCSRGEPEPAPAPPAPASSAVTPTPPESSAAAYVGSERCRECHVAQFSAWQTSQHHAAMQEPNASTVLGDFSAAIVAAREPTRFRHEGARYQVDTLGKSYEVKYTFGVRPLQQYLLDVGAGRLQAFTVAYDTRPHEQGGGRWYQLQPHEKTQPGDELHWTSAAYNWSSSCADCHSTHLQKNYDRAQNTYATRFSEISVGCEACHGPGSRHADQAKSGAFAAGRGLSRDFATPAERSWTFVEGRPIAVLAAANPRSVASAELEACAACHAHRADLGGDALAFHDRYRLDLLEADLYFPDGQQKAETFELGSFLQSKMYAAGVVCSDCHEPHAGSLRRPGNALCAGCHDAQHYDAPAHHLHVTATPQSQCVTCHMPTHTFMEIDARREHRFSVPRPDLTLTLGVPNPCTNGCHAEKRRGTKPDEAAASWASSVIREHFGPEREPSFGPALASGRALSKSGRAELTNVAKNERFAAIARATALVALRDYPEQPLAEVLPFARDTSPLLRRAFAELMGSRNPDERRQTLVPLLTDSVRSVRLEAARHLFDVASLTASEQAVLGPVLDDLRRSLEHNADRAGALLELASLELSRAAQPGSADGVALGLFARAEQLEPSLAVVYLNRADFLRERGRDDEAVATLQRGLEKCHERAPLEHALGLAEVRRGHKTAGLEHLRRAFELAPGSGQLGYVYAVALFDTGRVKDAITVLQKLHHAAPGDHETVQLLTRYLHESGDHTAATELEHEQSRSLDAAH